VTFPETVRSDVTVLAERVFISTLLTLRTAFLTFKVLSGDSNDIYYRGRNDLHVIKCGRTSPTDLAGFDFKLTFYKLGLESMTVSALSTDRWKIVHLVGLALSLPIVLDNTFV